MHPDAVGQVWQVLEQPRKLWTLHIAPGLLMSATLAVKAFTDQLLHLLLPERYAFHNEST